jgi:hypothetical protein
VTAYSDPQATLALEALYRNPRQKSLVGKVDHALDRLESAPTAADVRRHRFTGGGLCGIVVVEGSDGWAILWDGPDESGDVEVRYLGSASCLP